MNSLVCRLKRFLIIALLFFPQFLIAQENQNHYFKELTVKVLYGINNPADLCFPKPVKLLVDRFIVKEGKLVYFPQVLCPDYEKILLRETYLTSTDTGKWLDSLFIEVEETRLGEELSALEEIISEEQRETKESNTVIAAIQNELNQTGEEKYYFEGKNDYIQMEFNNEIFLYTIKEDFIEAIHSGEIIKRFFYDKNYRLVKKEVWNKEGTVLLSTEKLHYNEELNFVDEKILVTYKTDKTVKSEKGFSPEGKLISEKEYLILPKRELLLAERSWIYDSSLQLIQAAEKANTYNSINKIAYSFEKKTIYDYCNGKELPANSEYYENGKIKIRLIYDGAKGNYKKETFFEDDFSVLSYYENYKCVKEIFYSGKKVLRIKEYE